MSFIRGAIAGGEVFEGVPQAASKKAVVTLNKLASSSFFDEFTGESLLCSRMPKIQVTAQQRANALEGLNARWPSIRPEQVSYRLYTWREQPNEDGELSGDDVDLNKPPTCGSVACFGGWLEWWPPFRQQLNAYPDSGELEVDHPNDLLGSCGTGMFSERNRPLGDRFWAGCPADVGFEGTDHELVTNRLKWLIENSEVAG